MEDTANAFEQESPPVRRRPSEVRFPSYDLADSLAVAQAIHEKGGGVASPEQLAAHVGYKTTNSGAYLARVAAARAFGLIQKQGSNFVISPLAQKILMPVYPEQAREGLLEAFMTVPLFKSVYEEHLGKELPPEFGFKNLLRNKYNVPTDRVGNCLRVLMDSAEHAGLFSVRGARTHLIMPTVTRTPPTGGDTPPAGEKTGTEKPDEGGTGAGGGTGGRGGGRNSDGDTLESVRVEYLRKLISMVGDENVEDQKDLMTRIERLLMGGEAAE